ncbi:hypothetical protein CYMTET_9871, partial [Cymbomonas tetramitiformis]
MSSKEKEEPCSRGGSASSTGDSGNSWGNADARNRKPKFRPFSARPYSKGSESVKGPSETYYQRPRTLSARPRTGATKDTTRSEGGETGDVRGSLYQYFVQAADITRAGTPTKIEGQVTWKHFDVFCAWDKGQDAFDTYELAEGMRHRSLTYSYALYKVPADIMHLEAVWEKFLAAVEVDVDELATWANSLSPRSIHDFKPMIVLLQVTYFVRTPWAEEPGALQVSRPTALAAANQKSQGRC